MKSRDNVCVTFRKGYLGKEQERKVYFDREALDFLPISIGEKSEDLYTHIAKEIRLATKKLVDKHDLGVDEFPFPCFIYKIVYNSKQKCYQVLYKAGVEINDDIYIKIDRMQELDNIDTEFEFEKGFLPDIGDPQKEPLASQLKNHFSRFKATQEDNIKNAVFVSNLPKKPVFQPQAEIVTTPDRRDINALFEDKDLPLTSTYEAFKLQEDNQTEFDKLDKEIKEILSEAEKEEKEYQAKLDQLSKVSGGKKKIPSIRNGNRKDKICAFLSNHYLEGLKDDKESSASSLKKLVSGLTDTGKTLEMAIETQTTTVYEDRKDKQHKLNELKKQIAWALYEAAYNYYIAEFVTIHDPIEKARKILKFNKYFLGLVKIDDAGQLSAISEVYNIVERKSLKEMEYFVNTILDNSSTRLGFLDADVPIFGTAKKVKNLSNSLEKILNDFAKENPPFKTPFKVKPFAWSQEVYNLESEEDILKVKDLLIKREPSLPGFVSDTNICRNNIKSLKTELDQIKKYLKVEKTLKGLNDSIENKHTTIAGKHSQIEKFKREHADKKDVSAKFKFTFEQFKILVLQKRDIQKKIDGMLAPPKQVNPNDSSQIGSVLRAPKAINLEELNKYIDELEQVSKQLSELEEKADSDLNLIKESENEKELSIFKEDVNKGCEIVDKLISELKAKYQSKYIHPIFKKIFSDLEIKQVELNSLKAKYLESNLDRVEEGDSNKLVSCIDSTKSLGDVLEETIKQWDDFKKLEESYGALMTLLNEHEDEVSSIEKLNNEKFKSTELTKEVNRFYEIVGSLTNKKDALEKRKNEIFNANDPKISVLAKEKLEYELLRSEFFTSFNRIKLFPGFLQLQTAFKSAKKQFITDTKPLEEKINCYQNDDPEFAKRMNELLKGYMEKQKEIEVLATKCATITAFIPNVTSDVQTDLTMGEVKLNLQRMLKGAQNAMAMIQVELADKERFYAFKQKIKNYNSKQTLQLKDINLIPKEIKNTDNFSGLIKTYEHYQEILNKIANEFDVDKIDRIKQKELSDKESHFDRLVQLSFDVFDEIERRMAIEHNQFFIEIDGSLPAINDDINLKTPESEKYIQDFSKLYHCLDEQIILLEIDYFQNEKNPNSIYFDMMKDALFNLKKLRLNIELAVTQPQSMDINKKRIEIEKLQAELSEIYLQLEKGEASVDEFEKKKAELINACADRKKLFASAMKVLLSKPDKEIFLYNQSYELMKISDKFNISIKKQDELNNWKMVGQTYKEQASKYKKFGRDFDRESYQLYRSFKKYKSKSANLEVTLNKPNDDKSQPIDQTKKDKQEASFRPKSQIIEDSYEDDMSKVSSKTSDRIAEIDQLTQPVIQKPKEKTINLKTRSLRKKAQDLMASISSSKEDETEKKTFKVEKKKLEEPKKEVKNEELEIKEEKLEIEAEKPEEEKKPLEQDMDAGKRKILESPENMMALSQVFMKDSMHYAGYESKMVSFKKVLNKFLTEGNHDEYNRAIRQAYLNNKISLPTLILLNRLIVDLSQSPSISANELQSTISRYENRSGKGIFRKIYGNTKMISDLQVLQEYAAQEDKEKEDEKNKENKGKRQKLDPDEGTKIYKEDIALITELRDLRKSSFRKGQYDGQFLTYKNTNLSLFHSGNTIGFKKLSHTEDAIFELHQKFNQKAS